MCPLSNLNKALCSGTKISLFECHRRVRNSCAIFLSFLQMQGDSGGPLQCKQGSVWIQAGITSFGVPCATGTYPEVYARVSEYQEWITTQVSATVVNFVTFNSTGTDPDSSFVCPNSSPASTSVLLLSAVSLATLLLHHVLLM